MKYLGTKDFFNSIAKFYDIIMRDMDYKEWAFYIDEIIKKFSSGKRVLDLACGTGNISIKLSKKDYEVFGLDLSIEMLKVAKGKKLTNLVNASFDKLPFKNESFDVIFCAFDSLNNVESLEDLEQIFREAYRVLKKGGLFTFDLNTIHIFRTYWHNYIKVDEAENLYIIWRSKFVVPNMCLLKILVFEEVENGLYRKYSAQLLESAFEINSVLKALKNTNFNSSIAFEHLSFRRASEKNERIQFLAIK